MTISSFFFTMNSSLTLDFDFILLMSLSNIINNATALSVATNNFWLFVLNEFFSDLI